MKVVVIGATGSIGGAMLRSCLQRADIDTVVALARRPVTVVGSDGGDGISSKLQTIIVPDFGHLDAIDAGSWAKIVDADAIVWAMGTYTLDEQVNLNYPLAFQAAFAAQRERDMTPGKSASLNPVRFLLLSGAFVEPDQQKTLWFLQEQRRMKGVLQSKTLDFAKLHRDQGWQALILRPGAVVFGSHTSMVRRVAVHMLGPHLAIAAEVLGAATAALAARGDSEIIFNNRALVARGLSALKDTE